MHLSWSAVALAGLLVVSTSQVADAKKTRVRNLFTRKNKGLEHDAAKDAAFLKEALVDEDAEYWDRMLQVSATSVPTISTPTVPIPATPAPTPEDIPITPAPTPEGVTTCVNSGGTVENAMCCAGIGDFPNTCLLGACGCGPFDSAMVLVCQCPDGQCFNGNVCEAIGPAPTIPAPVPTNPPPTFPVPVPTNPVPVPTNPVPVPTNPPPTNPPPTNPPPTNPPPTNPPPTNPPPTFPPPTPPVSTSSFSFIRRTRRQRQVRKRNDSDAV